MMVLSVVLTGFTVWLLVWTFASGRKSPEFAGKVFMGLFCAAVFAANVAFFAAGRSQVIHGRWTQFALWVNRWLVGPE